MKSIQDLVKDLAGRRHYVLARYDAGRRRQWTDAVTRINSEREMLLNYGEACQLIGALIATGKLHGDVAEVGVAYGASAKLIPEFTPTRTIHLFDRFEGLPEPTHRDSSKFAAGQFRASMDSVRQYVGGTHVSFHRGLFPQTAEPVKDRVFSFVHLDVDLYESTMAGLRFFYPRLCRGGILISHDYLSSDGVSRAFEDFFPDKPEPVIELTGFQCMIVKLADTVPIAS